MMYLKLKRVKNILHTKSLVPIEVSSSCVKISRPHLLKISVPGSMFNQPKRNSVFQLKYCSHAARVREKIMIK